MKNYIKIFLPVSLAILIGSLTFIFAQTKNQAGGQFPDGERGFRPPMGRMGGGLPPRVLDKLNLTDAQKQQIKTLEDNARTASKDYFDKIKAFDEQLKSMLDAGTFSEDQARQILSGKAQAMTEVEIIHLRTEMAIKNILTTEQKTELEQLKQQHSEFPRAARPGMPPPPQN